MTNLGWAGWPLTNTWGANFSDGEIVSYAFQHDYLIQTTLTSGNRHVLRGATLADSISNLVQCISLNPLGSGTKYSASLAEVDLGLYSYSATSIVLTNRLDGVGQYGYVPAFGCGVLSVTKYSNAPIVFYGCYSASNLVHPFGGGTPYAVNFTNAFVGDACDGSNNVASLLQEGRDFFSATFPPYLPITTIASRSGPGRATGRRVR